MSLESLRFMLGGAIKKPDADTKVLVRHTAEVVVETDGKVPAPKKDDGTYWSIVASTSHPIKLINLGGGDDSASAGTRTQLTSGTMSGAENNITFSNTKAGVTDESPKKGDHIRIFWEEEVTGDANADAAVEVTISPDTLENPGEVSLIKITNCWKLLNEDNQQLRSA